jgi:hypothetical protein
MPNGWLPPIGHSPARALPPPVHALDAESGIAVPKRGHTFSPRTARHLAWHRSPNHAPPSPSTLSHLILPAMTRKPCTSTEPVRLPVGTARTRAPRPHHWTETTTSSPAHRPNPPIVSDESTLHRAHREQIKPRTPSPRPLCSSFAPLRTPLSSASSHILTATFSLVVPRPSELAGEPPKLGKKRGWLPSPATPLASLISLWLPRLSAMLMLHFSRARSDGSRRHRRPRRSVWKKRRRPRTAPLRRSPLRQHR